MARFRPSAARTCVAGTSVAGVGGAARLAAAAVLCLGLVTGATPAAAAPGTSEDPRQARAEARMAQPVQVRAQATADMTPAQAIVTINAHRSRHGIQPVTLDTASTAALNAHAKYVQLNVDDDDWYSQEQGMPGYTEAGAEIAQYAEVLPSVTLRGAVAQALSDPYLRESLLLDPTMQTIGFGGYSEVRTIVGRASGQAPTGYPRSHPAGANVTELRNSAPWLAGAGCGGAGFPVTAAFDYMTYGDRVVSSGKLLADGVPVDVCQLPTMALGAAQVAMVPQQALRPGTHYSGSITATLERLDGGTQSLTQAVDFSTSSSASKVTGDQTGDGFADVLAVRNSGELYLYKGRGNGTLGHGWKVGRGWDAMNWIAVAGDLNGDGRSDLLARRTDGTLWLYQSRGMGTWQAGRQVGRGWGGLSVLTVVGDVDGNGRPDLVGRTATGDLLRYELGSTIRALGRLGRNWNGFTHLAGVGSLNGDASADILAIRSDGTLWAYYTSAGKITSYRQAGRGWSGWTGLFVPGDLNGDGRLDMIGRNPAGELYSYLNRGSSFFPGTRAGYGWQDFRLLA
ncbi:hypothetical protein GCM10027030_24300 [Luteococcus sediminum]